MAKSTFRYASGALAPVYITYTNFSQSSCGGWSYEGSYTTIATNGRSKITVGFINGYHYNYWLGRFTGNLLTRRTHIGPYHFRSKMALWICLWTSIASDEIFENAKSTGCFSSEEFQILCPSWNAEYMLPILEAMGVCVQVGMKILPQL